MLTYYAARLPNLRAFGCHLGAEPRSAVDDEEFGRGADRAGQRDRGRSSRTPHHGAVENDYFKGRGLVMGPELAVADGALGFWQAIEEVWPKTRG